MWSINILSVIQSLLLTSPLDLVFTFALLDSSISWFLLGALFFGAFKLFLGMWLVAIWSIWPIMWIGVVMVNRLVDLLLLVTNYLGYSFLSISYILVVLHKLVFTNHSIFSFDLAFDLLWNLMSSVIIIWILLFNLVFVRILFLVVFRHLLVLTLGEVLCTHWLWVDVLALGHCDIPSASKGLLLLASGSA